MTADLLTVDEPDVDASSANIFTALRDKLPATEYAVFFEVSNAAGFERSRSADAIAMSLWPSRGLEILGFEMKVSRSDWLRELKDPAKAEAIAQYCDRWIVVAPQGIVKQAEVPTGWGLWELGNGRWRVTVAPPKLSPVALNRSFVSALLRRAGQADQRLVDGAVAKLRAADDSNNERRIKYEVERRARTHDTLAAAVAKFEKASGIEIRHEWTAGEMGKAVKLALTLQEDGLLNYATSLRNRLDALLAQSLPDEQAPACNGVPIK